MNQISKYRKIGGLSQQALAQQVGWGQSRLANYEVNARTPSLSDSRLIVTALNRLGVVCCLDDVFPPEKIRS
ncbi:helix-turn-helix transcriptional regulator [Enterobacter soli]|nr:helix-turn-helix transcriptional regulator [Enterobacter soli]MDD9245271.1 helix-turn-helix transcriptional regulator [Enterobacter soli]